MKNIPLPSRATARSDLIKVIKQYKYRGQFHGHTITEDEITAILAIYDRYDRDLGISSEYLKGSRLPVSLIDALEAAYDKTQENRKLYALRERLFQNVSLCPICGISPPVELDHFLPQSEFKTLAIYARNLVPLCHACNHTKLAGFGEIGDEDSRFIHAYFDILPDEQFLHARIDILGGGLVVEFSIAPQAAIPDGYARRLTKQMETLGLNERYEQEINTYLSSHAVTLHLHNVNGGQNAICKFLKIQARYEQDLFYRNHWRPTLLSALARHDGFTGGGFAEVLPLSEGISNELENL